MSSSSSEESPVAAILHLSGECLCGAFGSPDELQDLEWAYPRAAAWIRALERRAAFFGVERDRWGGEPGETARGRARPMCSDCEQRQQLALEGLAAGCPASPRARVRVHQRREGDLGEMAVRVHTPGRTPGPDARSSCTGQPGLSSTIACASKAAQWPRCAHQQRTASGCSASTRKR